MAIDLVIRGGTVIDGSGGAPYTRGITSEEMAYDLLLQDKGENILFVTLANYVDGNLDVAFSMVDHPHTLLGLGDGGAFDLPAGGRRLKQGASGYVATVVNGAVTYREGAATGVLPGRLVRGPRSCAS